MTPTLHTARLSLRPLARAEARVLAQIEAGTAMGWSVVPAGTDSIIGMVGLHHIDGTAAFAQIAYEIDAEYSGKGLATEAVERVIEHARTELGLLRLEAHIGPDDARLDGLAQRLGSGRDSDVEMYVVTQ